MEKCDISVISWNNGHTYKYKNKRITVVTTEENNGDSMLVFKRLIVVPIKDLAGIEDLNGLETSVRYRPYSKYIVITTRIKISLPSIECLHHGIGEVLKLHAMAVEDRELNTVHDKNEELN